MQESTNETSRSAKRPDAWWIVAVVVATLVGAVLRLRGLGATVMGGDEMHAVRSALTMELGRVLTTYRPSDNCIPLTAWFRMLLDSGLRPSEFWLKSPVWLAGIGLIPATGWVGARTSGRPLGATAAGLVALAPLLVYYSRNFRSYAVIALTCLLAATALLRWLEAPRWQRAVPFAIASSLSVWFHLVTVPLIGTLCLLALLSFADRELPRPALKSLAALYALVGSAIALFVGPALQSLLRLAALKNEPLALGWHTFDHASVLLFGFDSEVGRVLLVGLWAYGIRVAWRRSRAWGAILAVAPVGQLVGLLILSPKAMGQGPIMARYLLLLLPFVALAIAGALTHLMARLGTGGRLLGAGLVGAWVLFAAVPQLEKLGDPLAIRPEMLRNQILPYRPVGEVAKAYEWLIEQAPAAVIAEYPWHTTWRYSTYISAPWTVHRRPLVVLPGERNLWDDRLSGFRNLTAPTAAGLARSGASHLVVHLRPQVDVERYERPRKVNGDSALGRDQSHRRRELERYEQQAANRFGLFRRLCGAPDFRAGGIAVFELQSCRLSN